MNYVVKLSWLFILLGLALKAEATTTINTKFNEYYADNPSSCSLCHDSTGLIKTAYGNQLYSELLTNSPYRYYASFYSVGKLDADADGIPNGIEIVSGNDVNANAPLIGTFLSLSPYTQPLMWVEDNPAVISSSLLRGVPGTYEFLDVRLSLKLSELKPITFAYSQRFTGWNTNYYEVVNGKKSLATVVKASNYGKVTLLPHDLNPVFFVTTDFGDPLPSDFGKGGGCITGGSLFTYFFIAALLIMLVNTGSIVKLKRVNLASLAVDA